MNGQPVQQAGTLSIRALAGMPMFVPGMSVAGEVLAALAREGLGLEPDDILVVAQKIVSKAEGRLRRLAEAEPGAEARRIAGACRRAPELVQLILDESTEILRASPAAIIARHRTGHVLANAGIDASNVEGGSDDTVLLWPVDPDASARAIRAEISAATGIAPAIVIADSLGRPWRIGTTGAAIGCAGLGAVEDRRGVGKDLYGRTLQATVIAVADSLAAAATLVMGEGAEGTPAALVRGAGRWITSEDGPGAAAALRPLNEDMFR